MCQSLARAQWLKDRQAKLLDSEYFEVVTVPQEIAVVIAPKQAGPERAPAAGGGVTRTNPQSMTFFSTPQPTPFARSLPIQRAAAVW